MTAGAVATGIAQSCLAGPCGLTRFRWLPRRTLCRPSPSRIAGRVGTTRARGPVRGRPGRPGGWTGQGAASAASAAIAQPALPKTRSVRGSLRGGVAWPLAQTRWGCTIQCSLDRMELLLVLAVASVDWTGRTPPGSLRESNGAPPRPTKPCSAQRSCLRGLLVLWAPPFLWLARWVRSATLLRRSVRKASKLACIRRSRPSRLAQRVGDRSAGAIGPAYPQLRGH